MKRAGNKPLPLPVQLVLLKRAFPDARADIRASKLTWIGKLTPTPLSRTYTVRIEYAGRARPDVIVLDPQLEKRNGHLPHVFPGDRLCLNMTYEWDSGMRIADTVVPWASEWLYFYELWLPDGVWMGGGHEPPASAA